MYEDTFFKNKRPDTSRLLAYGFTESGGSFVYSCEISGDSLALSIKIDASGEVHTQAVERDTGEEYVLYRVPGASGGFVGAVKAECERILTDVAEKCFVPDDFKSPQTKQLIEYIRGRYGDEPEFLWEKFPDYAAFRRKDNRKWYAVIMTIPLKKLGLKSAETAEIVDLRISPELVPSTVDNERFFPGWHMSKKTWYTVVTDGSVPSQELFRRVDESYLLAAKPK